MGIKRVVDTDFWNDSKVIDLFSPEDKYFMLYLLTNPHTTQLGIYELNKKKAAFELGYSNDVVGTLIERFEKKYDMIRYSKSTSEIAIKNFLRHSIIKGGKPVEDLLDKEIRKVKDRTLLTFVFKSLELYGNLNDTVKRVIIQNDIKNDNDNDNDNENENEVSYHDSYHDTYHDSSDKPKTVDKSKIKHKYGEYNNVLLKDTDLEKLKVEYGEDKTLKAIKYLDEYIEMKGAKYKSHYLVIRKWVVDAVNEREKKGGDKGGQARGKVESDNELDCTKIFAERFKDKDLGDLPFMQ